MLLLGGSGHGQLGKRDGDLEERYHRFPLAYAQMQLSHSLYQSGGHLKLNWRPRELNTLADELTNEAFDHFDPAKRVHVSLDDLDFALLHRLVQHHSQISSWRQKGVATSSKVGRAKRAKFDKTKWG